VRVEPTPLTVEIIYALPQRAIRMELTFDSAATIEDALRLAAVDPVFTDIDLENCTCGIYGRVARGDQALRAGDRIEIYRPLAADPKNARRERVKQARKKRQ
jgi:putative ubiquitin-RnfH superfamily antitoxin RatB of RatAB toxin-antitoxin module